MCRIPQHFRLFVLICFLDVLYSFVSGHLGNRLLMLPV